MTETNSPIDMLGARLDHQAASIDSVSDEVLQTKDAPLERETRARSSRRPRTRLRVGTATGV